MLIGFILSMAAGFFLQPYVAKIRWPKFKAHPEYLEITREPRLQKVIGQYAESVLDHHHNSASWSDPTVYEYGGRRY